MKIAMALLVAAIGLPASFDGKTFSNTQSWDPAYLRELESYHPDFIDFENAVEIVTPFAIPSREQLVDEIKVLHTKERSRTPEKIAEILRQRSFCGETVGGFAFGNFPAIDEPVMRLYWEATYLGFFLKRRFDMVRPSFFDPTLRPAIEVPHHPAFPSNHSLQNMTVALVLAELFPESRERLLAHARLIGENREWAGVHYASDTVAGRVAAEWLVKNALSNSRFTDLMRDARLLIAGRTLAEFRAGTNEACDAMFAGPEKR